MIDYVIFGGEKKRTDGIILRLVLYHVTLLFVVNVLGNKSGWAGR